MSNSSTIQIFKNKVFTDNRGQVRHFFNSNLFNLNVEEIYFSSIVYPNIKGWKFHENKNQLFSVVSGKIKFYIGSLNPNNKITVIREIILTFDENNSLFLPSKNWYAFENIQENDSMLINAVDIEHSAAISRELPFNR